MLLEKFKLDVLPDIAQQQIDGKQCEMNCLDWYVPHYENLPMKYNGDFFFWLKNLNFHFKKMLFFFAQRIDRGYTLEPPCRGGSNEYPQSMFWSKNKKNR